jgi:hypothetical protein
MQLISTLSQFLTIAESQTALDAVYPNPFTDILTVRFDHRVEHAYIVISDVTGNVVHEETYSGMEYRFYRGDLARGIYFISIRQEDGDEIIRKIVAE